MIPDFDIRPMIERHSAIPLGRLRVVQDASTLRLAEIRRGIVFVFAAWSGPAVEAFERFTRLMKPIASSSIDLVVVDTDCLTAESATQLFGTGHFATGGWGEVVWVRNGNVTAREIARVCSNALLQRHTDALLNDEVV